MDPVLEAVSWEGVRTLSSVWTRFSRSPVQAHKSLVGDQTCAFTWALGTEAMPADGVLGVSFLRRSVTLIS